MERLPNSRISTKKNQFIFNDKHIRHRNADCKYRSNVQYLYSQMRSLLGKKTAKDGLLDNALGFIQHLENEISDTSGADHMENCKKDFLNFLIEEEIIWKKEKDIDKWWAKVNGLLSKDDPLNLAQKKLVSITKDNKKPSKSVKQPSSRKSLKSSKNLIKNGTSCSGCVNEHMYTLPYNEEILNMYVDKSVRTKEVYSSSWNLPEVTSFRPFVSINNKGDSMNEETMSSNSISSNSNDIFSTGHPLEMSCVAVPVDNSSICAMECSQQAQSSILHL